MIEVSALSHVFWDLAGPFRVGALGTNSKYAGIFVDRPTQAANGHTASAARAWKPFARVRDACMEDANTATKDH